MTLRCLRGLARRSIDGRRTTKFCLSNHGIILNDRHLGLALLHVVKGRHAQDDKIRHVRRASKSVNVLNELSTNEIRGLNARMYRLNNLFRVRVARQHDLIRGAKIIIIRTISVHPGLSFKDISNDAGRQDHVITSTALRVICLTMNITTSMPLDSVGLDVQVRFRLGLRLILSVSQVKLNVLIHARMFWDQGRRELRTTFLRVMIRRNNKGRLTLDRRRFLLGRDRRIFNVEASVIGV